MNQEDLDSVAFRPRQSDSSNRTTVLNVCFLTSNDLLDALTSLFGTHTIALVAERPARNLDCSSDQLRAASDLGCLGERLLTMGSIRASRDEV